MRTLALLLILAPALFSCGQQDVRIDFGKAECAHCRMNVVDKQFGAALTTLKGRQYVFDDISCMVRHVGDGTIAEDQVTAWYVCDHAEPGKLIDATTAFYLHGPAFRSPMRGDVAAFSSEEKQQRAMVQDKTEVLDWAGVRELLMQ
ncbi:MAG: nitrous oxide reductase accessory protein NosL [Flavobacteriales bacterium]|nr:nitrous oxide reductase accessory protein NosL [Flavobacteriales bacterium]